MKVKYRGDIDQFLLEIDNWNVKANVTAVSLRKTIEDQIPKEVVRRRSLIDPISDESEWLEAIRTAVRKEDFQEGRKLRHTDSLGSDSSRKRK